MVKAAYIQTSDGFYVKMDASILYCIEDPVKLVNRVGAGKLYEDNGILPVAENAIKVRLGTLQPEDFFDAKTRVAKLEEARDLMNEKLQPMGIKVKHVLAEVSPPAPRCGRAGGREQPPETNQAAQRLAHRAGRGRG